MAATIGDVRAGLAAAVSVVYGGDWQVSAYLLSDPTPPFVHIFPGSVRPHIVNAPEQGLTMIVEAVVALSTDRGAQELLDAIIDPISDRSLQKALEADVTLGGIVDDVTVREIGDYGPYQLPAIGAEGLGARWTVAVMT